MADLMKNEQKYRQILHYLKKEPMIAYQTDTVWNMCKY